MPPLKDPRQERFAREYIRHGRGERAVIAAGYKAKTWVEHGSTSASVQANKLLKLTHVRFRIQELQEQRARKADISDSYVLARLKKITERCLQEVRPILARGPGGAMVETGEFEFDSAGANKALYMIGTYLGMFEKTPQQVGGQTTNTQINFYFPQNHRVGNHGQHSNGSGEGSAAADTGRPKSVLALPSNGHS